MKSGKTISHLTAVVLLDYAEIGCVILLFIRFPDPLFVYSRSWSSWVTSCQRVLALNGWIIYLPLRFVANVFPSITSAVPFLSTKPTSAKTAAHNESYQETKRKAKKEKETLAKFSLL
uniref:Uncharacterized protein n=1 Tax=Glossina austeni TaxID=7395 RepID=A0A1A9VC46_GLOAU